VLRLGINEWPMPGRLVRKDTYEREYHELLRGHAKESWEYLGFRATRRASWKSWPVR